MTSFDWLKVVDAKRALRNVRLDMVGDWYLDPWEWPETAWVVDKEPQHLVDRLNETGARPALPIDVLKENFAVRPAVVLDPIDRLAYQALVDRVSLKAIGNMRSWAYGWRLPRKSPNSGEYMKNATEWEYYRHRLTMLSGQHLHGLTTDITSFFASIDTMRLLDDLRSQVGADVVVDRIRTFLEGLATIPSRSGLPQRCAASSSLAQFYLIPLDDLLQQLAPTSPLHKHPAVARWMDDVWLFNDDQMALRIAQLAIQQLLHRRGLMMNGGKTDIYSGTALVRQAAAIEHSAVDQALAAQPPNLIPLQVLVEMLCNDPEASSRTSVRFAATRISAAKAYTLVDSLADVALRCPQGADHLARLLRESGRWQALGDWYVESCRKYGEALAWPLYHLGMMFPTAGTPPASLVAYWLASLSAGELPVIMVPLAVQRLAAWDTDQARAAIQSAATRPAYRHPLVLRALAIGGRTCNLAATDSKQILKQVPETNLFLSYMEARSMKAPKVSAMVG
jgi:hypothetical protein